MAATSSSPLLLIIDTDHDTHILLTIDGDQSIAQLKAKIITDHANCFPQFGKISVLAVKSKCGEFFYHLPDSTILNCFSQSVEGAKRFQVDIVCGIPEKANFVSYMKDDSKGDLHNTERSRVEHGDSSMRKMGDASPKKKLLETDEDMNHKRIHEPPVQLDTNATTKVPADPKPRGKKKKKVSRDKELFAGPLVQDSLHKINDSRADNHQPKESIIISEKISNSNDITNESGIAASTKESSQPIAVQHVELSLQAKVDDTATDKVVEVPSPSKPLNNTATDKMLKHGDIKDYSKGNDPTIQFSNDPASQIPKERFILGLAASPNETTSEAIGKHGGGIIVGLANSTKEVAPTEKRRRKPVVEKNPSSRFRIESKKANENELALTFVQSEKNVGSGSITHDTEKAKSDSHTKDDPNVNLDGTKTLPVQHGDSLMSKLGDASQKNQIKMDISSHMEKKLLETDQDVNRNRINEAPVQLDANTTIKDLADPKLKRKKKKKISSERELSANPLVQGSLHKINDSQVDNQAKESIIIRETISNSNDFGNECGIAAFTKESSQPSNAQQVELLLLANVDDIATNKVVEVPCPSKQLSNTATDKTLKHENIKENSTVNVPTIQFLKDSASQIPKERFVPELAISPNETTSESTGKHGSGNIASLDNNIKEIAPSQKRRHKRVVRKISSSRLGNGSKKSNEDGLASTFLQSEKNDVSGSNTHDAEKAKSDNHTKDDSNVNMDSTKIVPAEKIRRKRS